MIRKLAGAVTGWDRLDWDQKRALRHRASCIGHRAAADPIAAAAEMGWIGQGDAGAP
jgi:hypothetical protein